MLANPVIMAGKPISQLPVLVSLTKATATAKSYQHFMQAPATLAGDLLIIICQSHVSKTTHRQDYTAVHDVVGKVGFYYRWITTDTPVHNFWYSTTTKFRGRYGVFAIIRGAKSADFNWSGEAALTSWSTSSLVPGFTASSKALSLLMLGSSTIAIVASGTINNDFTELWDDHNLTLPYSYSFIGSKEVAAGDVGLTTISLTAQRWNGQLFGVLAYP